jgi:hypothetical protein
MRIIKTYSHLNGLEFLLARRPELWNEIQSTIVSIDAAACKTKQSKEKRKQSKTLFSPKDLNKAFEFSFQAQGWKSVQAGYWVCEDPGVNRKTMDLNPEAQKAAILDAGLTPYWSYNQTDFVKDRVAVEVQLGKYSFIAYDLFVKHMAFYVADKIDLGVEIIPMKSFQSEMSSGPGYFEGELYNIIREGRGVPAVPLIIIGIDA